MIAVILSCQLLDASLTNYWTLFWVLVWTKLWMISLSSSSLFLPPPFLKTLPPTVISWHEMQWMSRPERIHLQKMRHNAAIEFFGCMGICTILLPELNIPFWLLKFLKLCQNFFLCIFPNIPCSKEKVSDYYYDIGEAYPNFNVVWQYFMYLSGII